jgi:hypothetical protein
VSVHTIGIGRGERVQVQVSPVASLYLFVACRFGVFCCCVVPRIKRLIGVRRDDAGSGFSLVSPSDEIEPRITTHIL